MVPEIPGWLGPRPPAKRRITAYFRQQGVYPKLEHLRPFFAP